MLYYVKKLFFILTFCIFLGLGNFVSVAAETDVCATLKAEPEIEFTTSYGKLKYDFGYNQQGLTRLGQQYGIVEQGLFASGLAVVGVNWEVSLNTISRVVNDTDICVVPTSLNVFIGYQDPTIFISNQLQPGSCEYNVVVRHEQTHHQINTAALEYFIPSLRRSVQKIARDIKPYRIDSPSKIDEATNTLTEMYIAEIEPLIRHFKSELMQEQSKLDNQTNYQMESDLCRRFNGRRPQNRQP